MNKKILILKPDSQEGQPVFERTQSFIDFYVSHGVEVSVLKTPRNIYEVLKIIVFIYKMGIKNVFITMPPFRNWVLFLLPYINIILDIRDGWSIAIKSGYGGIVKPNKIKYFISRYIEKMAIKRSCLTITCTPGLQNYLRKLSDNNIVLITNGYSKKNHEIINILKNEQLSTKDNAIDVAVCAGKFSEYGTDKVKKILYKISTYDENKKTIIKLIGTDRISNDWINEWLRDDKINNIELEILPRMNREEMYKNILEADYGIAVIRDPNYDFGTKVFDYILCDIPIFDYFDEPNNFTDYFKPFLTSVSEKTFTKSFLRGSIIDEKRDDLLGCMK